MDEFDINSNSIQLKQNDFTHPNMTQLCLDQRSSWIWNNSSRRVSQASSHKLSHLLVGSSVLLSKLVLVVTTCLVLNACTTGQVDEGEATSGEAESSLADDNSSSSNNETNNDISGDSKPNDSVSSLEDEIAQSEPATPQPSNNDELALDNTTNNTAPAEVVPPPTVVEEKPLVSKLVNLKNMKFKGNDSGGTLVIEGDGPINYTTRKNASNNQYIIEISNSFLPNKLKRPMITKDFASMFGAVDAYQNPGSSTSRIVIQLREGVADPIVQLEGNSLLVMGSSEVVAHKSVDPVPATAPTSVPSVNESLGESSSDASSSEPSYTEDEKRILSSRSLEEFLSSNTKFYGKKISLEVNEMDVKEVIKLLSDESGVNLIIADEVKGTISLKLKDVPWDQILVLIMKTKKLGYVRNGNVLRIAPITDIKQEENEAALFAENMKKQSPLKVRMLPINYASVTDIEGKAKAFLSERGRIIGDARTSSVVISDIEENISRVIKYIQSIDVAPPQVMIEGKVVEASDTFSRDIGINWSTTGKAVDAGTNSTGEPIRQRASLESKTPITATTFGINYTIGSLDLFGNINARLGLFEREGLVKVLSSPRILAIHNESAEINQTTEVPVVTATATTTSAGQSSTTTVSYKPVTLKLKVTPLVANTGTVQLNVDVNREFISEKGEISGAAYTAVGKRSAVTKVMVRNGQTAVIGGIYQTDTNQTEARVPWLSDIPILGWLFKNRSTNNAKTELMIFLTPRILGQADSQTSTGGEL